MSLLAGKKYAVLATNGYEDSELAHPIEAIKLAGGEVDVISTETGSIKGKNGTTVEVDVVSKEAAADNYDGLVLPGGVGNSDTIRMDTHAVDFVKDIFAADKPVAVICHGGSILTDADVLKGRTLTSYPSIKTDLINAGAQWVDEEVHVDNRLISSRTPDDLEAFNEQIVKLF